MRPRKVENHVHRSRNARRGVGRGGDRLLRSSRLAREWRTSSISVAWRRTTPSLPSLAWSDLTMHVRTTRPARSWVRSAPPRPTPRMSAEDFASGSTRTPRLAAHGPSPCCATSPPPPGPPARGQPSSSSARSTCRADHPELLPQCWQVRSRSDTGGGTRPRRSATRYGSARRHGMRSCSTAGRSRRSGRTGRPTSTLDSSCARWATGPPERRRSPRP